MGLASLDVPKREALPTKPSHLDAGRVGSASLFHLEREAQKWHPVDGALVHGMIFAIILTKNVI